MGKKSSKANAALQREVAKRADATISTDATYVYESDNSCSGTKTKIDNLQKGRKRAWDNTSDVGSGRPHKSTCQVQEWRTRMGKTKKAHAVLMQPSVAFFLR
jgi:hypothetical protein